MNPALFSESALKGNGVLTAASDHKEFIVTRDIMREYGEH